MAIEIQDSNKSNVNSLATRQVSLFAPRVTTADRLFFTEQLALLLETGVSLHAAVDALASQTQKGALRELLRALADDIANGSPFSVALSGHPEVFDASFVNLVSAAEQGGFLHEVLSELLELQEKREALRSTLIGAATYPLFLMTFSVAVVLFILWVVFPKFGDMFASIHDQLPWTTRWLMLMSDTLRHHWPIVFGVFLALAFLVRLWWRSPAGQLIVDHARIHWPGLRSLFIPVYLIQMLRTMGLSLNHGVSVVDTLGGCRDVVSNRSIAMFLQRVETDVREGKPFAHTFTRATFLPPLVCRMITTGDETGSLGTVMLRIASHYEREVAKRLDYVTKIAEPAMLLIMGALVGIIVSALILPIFKLTRAVG